MVFDVSSNLSCNQNSKLVARLPAGFRRLILPTPASTATSYFSSAAKVLPSQLYHIHVQDASMRYNHTTRTKPTSKPQRPSLSCSLQRCWENERVNIYTVYSCRWSPACNYQALSSETVKIQLLPSQQHCATI